MSTPKSQTKQQQQQIYSQQQQTTTLAAFNSHQNSSLKVPCQHLRKTICHSNLDSTSLKKPIQAQHQQTETKTGISFSVQFPKTPIQQQQNQVLKQQMKTTTIASLTNQAKVTLALGYVKKNFWPAMRFELCTPALK